MHELTFTLHAASALAPGIGSLTDLKEACRRGMPPPADEPLSLPNPERLPANERRRATQVVRLTLRCIEQALTACAFPAETLRTVFATDEGTGEVCQQMLEALATTRQVSPLLFANSVPNAPAGYFSIAYGNRLPATVVSSGLESFAGGLLCAVIDAVNSRQPVLLVAYDAAMTTPMDEVLPITDPVATAWLVSASAGLVAPTLASFVLRLAASGAPTRAAFPPWLPPRWANHSSALGLVALGLLERDAGATCRLPLGGVELTLQRRELLQ